MITHIAHQYKALASINNIVSVDIIDKCCACEVIQVGWVINGMQPKLYVISTNCVMRLLLSYLIKSMLKFPAMQ